MNKLSLLLLLVVLGSKLVNAQKQPRNSATIHGTIVDFDRFKDKVNQVKITVTDPVKVVHALTPNKDGFFTLTFPKQFQQDILIQFNDYTPIKTLIAPGQTQTWVKYIVKNSTGKVRDIWLANLITESLKRKDKDIRFQKRLMRDYKEFAPNGIYTKQLEEQLAMLLKK